MDFLKVTLEQKKSLNVIVNKFTFVIYKVNLHAIQNYLKK